MKCESLASKDIIKRLKLDDIKDTKSSQINNFDEVKIEYSLPNKMKS